MVANVTDRLWEMSDIVDVLEHRRRPLKGLSASMAKMNRWAISAICLGAIVVPLSIIYWIRSSTPQDEVYAIDGPATQAAVLKVIPIGSKIELAKTTMEAKGFHCLMEYNKRYAGDDPAGGRRQINYPAADILWCDSARPVRILVSKRWQVIFAVKNATVISVAAGVGLTGL
jgi:hypothetical protein